MALPAAPNPRRASAAIRQAVYVVAAMLAGGGATLAALSRTEIPRPVPRAPAMVVALPAVPVLVVVAPVPEPAAAPVVSVDVDSVAQGFPLSVARIENLSTGWIDAVALDDDGAVLRVSGWAGDPGLGLRIPYVAVGACGQAVAVVRVDRPRPDVAHDIHPNLDRAGWQARLFAAHLPDCADRRIEAHAMLPGGQAVVPLQQPDGLSLAGLRADASAVPHGPPGLIAPGDLALAPPARIRIANPVVLRRCAQPACAGVGQMARGENRVLTLDRRDGWALVHVTSDKRVGWLPEASFEKLPERVAQR